MTLFSCTLIFCFLPITYHAMFSLHKKIVFLNNFLTITTSTRNRIILHSFLRELGKRLSNRIDVKSTILTSIGRVTSDSFIFLSFSLLWPLGSGPQSSPQARILGFVDFSCKCKWPPLWTTTIIATFRPSRVYIAENDANSAADFGSG